ncbi:MAG: DUF2177 family protein [Pseudomonadota bacterium]
MTFILAYIVTAVVFLAIDFVWLAYIMKDFFQNSIGHLMADEPNLAVAAGFYILYAAGIVYFAIMPGLQNGSWMTVAFNATFFGLLAYGTYEATNLATLKDWPVKMAIIDTAWGAALTATSALAGYFAVQFFNSAS